MAEEKRYAVVSCHVERPLDDRVWDAFSRVQARAPSGFRIAALIRPPDEHAGEDVDEWVVRAQEAAARGPLGHHTHWGGTGQARPRQGDPAERVQREGEWLRDVGLRPAIFCGGGWYFDARVAAAAAELGYVDCTGTAFVPTYLDGDALRLDAAEPCVLELDGGRRLLELPTTHTLGMLARRVLRRGALDAPFVHAYFHDADLLDRRRRIALTAALAVLAGRRTPSDLDRARAELESTTLPSRSFAAGAQARSGA
jgi:hypothetical protein